MHWLLLVALLSSTTDMKSGGSSSTLSRLAEKSLRRQLGSVNRVSVQVTPGRNGGGDLDAFNVTLDGFSADGLAGLDGQSSGDYSAPPRDDDYYPGNGSDGSYNPFPNNPFPNDNSNSGYGLPRYDPSRRLDTSQRRSIGADDIGDILGGIGGGKGGDIGDILGDVLGGGGVGGIGGKTGGRVGRLRLKATNFSFGGARYESLSADLGEIRFDWKKALRGQMDVQSIAPGTLALSLRGDQLARLLGPRLPSLSDVKVRFANGRAFVGAKSGAYGVRLPFEVGARLSVQQNRVMATDFAASVARLRLPSFVLKELTQGVNPLYDFDPRGRWPLAINLSTAQAGNGVLAMRGGVQWLGLNGRGNRNGDVQNDRDNRYPEATYPDEQDSRDNRERDSRNRNNKPGDILGDIFGR